MAPQWIWWIVGFGLVAAELVTGTFYLLAIGIAFLVGGVAAWLGAPTEVQYLITAILALVGTALAHRWRQRLAAPPPQPPLDVGQSVHVQSWRADGSARVVYRGTHWDAVPATPDMPRDATMVIVAVRGSTLVIAPLPPAA